LPPAHPPATHKMASRDWPSSTLATSSKTAFSYKSRN
jgi:hypothetical protein